MISSGPSVRGLKCWVVCTLMLLISPLLCEMGDEHYRSTGKVWQTLIIGKSPRTPNNLIISGAVHGQISGHIV